MKVIAIVGPTAVGKSDIAVSLAKQINGEIINMDSMQVYKYLNIGSAKPTKEEMNGIKHYLIDEISPFDEFSVSDFKESAQKYIVEISNKNKIPIIVGGTGLYLNSLYYNMDFNKVKKDSEYRKELENIVIEHGNQYLHNMLFEVDPTIAKDIHPNNIKRIIRALEINKFSGENMKSYKKNLTLNKDYEVLLIGLNMERVSLYERINKRVDIMLSSGLLEEVKNLKNMGLDDNFTSMKGIGYREVLLYFNNEYDLDTLVSILKQNSRKYAKRQLTWLRQYEFINWYNVDSYLNKAELLVDIENKVRNFIGN